MSWLNYPAVAYLGKTRFVLEKMYRQLFVIRGSALGSWLGVFSAVPRLPFMRRILKPTARGPRDHESIRIRQTMTSGILLPLGLGTRM